MWQQACRQQNECNVRCLIHNFSLLLKFKTKVVFQCHYFFFISSKSRCIVNCINKFTIFTSSRLNNDYFGNLLFEETRKTDSNSMRIFRMYNIHMCSRWILNEQLFHMPMKFERSFRFLHAISGNNFFIQEFTSSTAIQFGLCFAFCYVFCLFACSYVLVFYRLNQGRVLD